jgi:phosphoglycerol transferase MdoB-like AlkP superfamily enzyme
MYFHPIFVLIPVLAIAAILGMSFAIVGTGHRKAWMLVLPIVIAVWYIVEQVIASFVRSSLLLIFWGLALPVIVSVAAWIFRRCRESHGA